MTTTMTRQTKHGTVQISLVLMLLSILHECQIYQSYQTVSAQQDKQHTDNSDGQKTLVAPTRTTTPLIVVKIGGSSITDKSSFETLRPDVLDWFAKTIASSLSTEFTDPDQHFYHHQHHGDDDDDARECSSNDDESGTNSSRRHGFVIVHGAGSFGHFQAKQYGLKGQSTPPTNSSSVSGESSTTKRRYQNRGLAATRLSVQKLNKIVVGALLDHGVNAIGISPCLNVPGVEAHVMLQGPTGPASLLRQVVQRTLEAGLVPILHGDACLYGHDQVGILSGDTLVEIIGTTSWISSAVFLTDVDGVFTDDPRINPNARLLREIAVDTLTNELIVVQSSSDGSDNNGDAKRIKTVVSASGSSHSHDVTGGLKTKLKLAATIAASMKNVTIIKYGTVCAEQALRGNGVIETGTILHPKN